MTRVEDLTDGRLVELLELNPDPIATVRLEVLAELARRVLQARASQPMTTAEARRRRRARREAEQYHAGP